MGSKAVILKTTFLLEKPLIVDRSDYSNRKSTIKIAMLKAILSDSQFWIPLIVLLLGVVLLVSLR
jgi:hypothetical protein